MIGVQGQLLTGMSVIHLVSALGCPPVRVWCFRLPNRSDSFAHVKPLTYLFRVFERSRSFYLISWLVSLLRINKHCKMRFNTRTYVRRNISNSKSRVNIPSRIDTIHFLLQRHLTWLSYRRALWPSVPYIFWFFARNAIEKLPPSKGIKVTIR